VNIVDNVRPRHVSLLLRPHAVRRLIAETTFPFQDYTNEDSDVFAIFSHIINSLMSDSERLSYIQQIEQVGNNTLFCLLYLSSCGSRITIARTICTPRPIDVYCARIENC